MHTRRMQVSVTKRFGGRQRLKPRGEALVGSLRSLYGLRPLSVDAICLMARRYRPKPDLGTTEQSGGRQSFGHCQRYERLAVGVRRLSQVAQACL